MAKFRIVVAERILLKANTVFWPSERRFFRKIAEHALKVFFREEGWALEDFVLSVVFNECVVIVDNYPSRSKDLLSKRRLIVKTKQYKKLLQVAVIFNEFISPKSFVR